MAIGPMNSQTLPPLSGRSPLGTVTGSAPQEAIETLRQIAGPNMGLRKGALSEFALDPSGMPVLSPKGSLPSPFQDLMGRMLAGDPEVFARISKMPQDQVEKMIKQAATVSSERGVSGVGQNVGAATGSLDAIRANIERLDSMAQAGLNQIRSLVPDALAARGNSIALGNLAQIFGANGMNDVANAIFGNTGATGTSQSAATGIGSTSSAATGSTGGDFESGLLSKISGPPPMPANVKDERQMLEYQRAMQLYTAMVQMITQVMQMLHEARKNIIQNLRA